MCVLFSSTKSRVISRSEMKNIAKRRIKQSIMADKENKKEDLFRIGVITEPHGIRGEVKVYPTSDDPAHIKKVKEIFLDSGKEKILLHTESVRFQKQFLLIKFKEFNTRDDVERLRKKELYVTRANAVPLYENEYYISDLIGLDIIDEEEKKIGVLQEVLQTGANDVYQILLEDGRELLLPAIKECVLKVNLEENFMQVHVMDGLL